jgi:hypothetical protein
MTLTPEQLETLLRVVEKATQTRWEYRHPFRVGLLGTDKLLVELPDHVRPLTVDQARQCQDDYRHIAAFDPPTCAELVKEAIRLRKWQRDVEGREAATCPEDVPFDEYIRSLEKRTTNDS